MLRGSESNRQGVHYFPPTTADAAGPAQRICGEDPIAVYVHIPFCEKRCHFCEFAVVAGARAKDAMGDDYVAAVKREVSRFLADQKRRPRVELIQFGGGTPTALHADQLEDLLNFLFEQFDCSELEEVIVEGFPGSITSAHIAWMERIRGLKLNIGVQSFQLDCLESVGREHGAQAQDAIRQAVSADIASVGVDIIFGLPNSTTQTVTEDLAIAAALGVEHFALYPLWVYDKTPLGSRVRAGKARVPDGKDQRTQFIAGCAALGKLGFTRYTAFHHACNAAARHRYGIWQMQAREWVGFGMSAMSHLSGDVFVNDRKIRSYMAKVDATDNSVSQRFPMSERERKAFVLLYGIRLREYPVAEFSAEFGTSLQADFDAEISDLKARDYLQASDKTVSLTLEGILNLDTIESLVNDAPLSALPVHTPEPQSLSVHGAINDPSSESSFASHY